VEVSLNRRKLKVKGRYGMALVTVIPLINMHKYYSRHCGDSSRSLHSRKGDKSEVE
jgi:hypothetical protein